MSFWPAQLLNFILDLRLKREARVFAAREKHLMFLIECFSQHSSATLARTTHLTAARR